MLNAPLRLTWGLDTEKLITLYKTIIVPKLLYGCSVWSRVLLIKSYKSKLLTVQRNMLKCVTRSFKNVPLNVLLIISNLLPIDLKAIEFSASHYLSHNTKDFTPSSAATIGALLRDFRLDRWMDHTRRFHSTRHPPWEVRPLSFITV